jgi:hypothetical protein
MCGAEAEVLERPVGIWGVMRRLAAPPFGGVCGSCPSFRRSWAPLIGRQARHEIRHRNRFGTVGTGPTGADSPTEHVAVRAALRAQEPRAAGRTLIDRGRPGCPRGERREHNGVTPPPGGLPARRRTVAAPATARRWAPADGADPVSERYAIVTRRGFAPVGVGPRHAIGWWGGHPFAPFAPFASLDPAGVPVGAVGEAVFSARAAAVAMAPTRR